MQGGLPPQLSALAIPPVIPAFTVRASFSPPESGIVKGRDTELSKRHQPLAGARPVFESRSVTPVSRPARVTGKRVNVSSGIVYADMKSGTSPNGKNYNRLTVARPDECDYSLGKPRMTRRRIEALKEVQAEREIYGPTAFAGSKAFRYRQDDKRNFHCGVLLPHSGICEVCGDKVSRRTGEK